MLINEPFWLEISKSFFRPLNPFGESTPGLSLNPHYSYSKSSFSNFQNQKVNFHLDFIKKQLLFHDILRKLYYFQLYIWLDISTSETVWRKMSTLNTFQAKKLWYLPHYWLNKGLKATVGNRAFPFTGRSLVITRTVS